MRKSELATILIMAVLLFIVGGITAGNRISFLVNPNNSSGKKIAEITRAGTSESVQSSKGCRPNACPDFDCPAGQKLAKDTWGCPICGCESDGTVAGAATASAASITTYLPPSPTKVPVPTLRPSATPLSSSITPIPSLTVTPSLTPPPSCSDSDGGINPDTFGVVNGTGPTCLSTLTDQCYDERTLVESYCSTEPDQQGWCRLKSITCEGKCVEGKCVK